MFSKFPEWVSSNQGFGTGSFAALLIGSLLSVALFLLLVTVCALRKKAYNLRNNSTTPTKQIEITQGDDQRYVVSYQVKSEIKQPDILNRGMYLNNVLNYFIEIVVTNTYNRLILWTYNYKCKN